ncbi:GAF domain-containing sensor histidine kinase [Deinococcus cellulosilyticus]|uniref:histidine kinase n=1 Tax=Deinococcus cellulosilyticus (strain DSM 18568 / NBRC 106333 / KACC 11606 / 5516J-15) TaxID=1223518 RepID=A0A511MVU0_DEIC1|nr:ATP-binding protein [Deinococcus cellulosilyticus]GEM44680.1 hypothetical protein DC3_03150 [Deinococcus cellulosilyticus NBRC 106333 = KACC 11606]
MHSGHLALPRATGWGAFADQIVNHTQQVLGYPYVFLTQYHPERGEAGCVAWAGFHLEPVKRTLNAVQRLLPHFDPVGTVAPVRANPLTASVYLEARVVQAPAMQVIQGAVPPMVVHLAGKIAGVTHIMMLPLELEGRVYGALVCCHNKAQVPEREVETARAFASQVAFGIHNAELRKQQEEAMKALQDSRELLSLAEERTRRMISEHLHSRVQSRLLVAWYQLGQVQALDATQQQTLEEVRAALDHIREHEVRLISHQLHPEALQIGLIAALQVLADRLQPVVRVQIRADSALIRLEDGVEEGLAADRRLVAFRVIEEALGNTIRHGQAREALLSLRLGEGHLDLEVQDNGVGFDPATRSNDGLGLRWIQARVEQVGGQWGIESHKGGPTRLWARIPR